MTRIKFCGFTRAGDIAEAVALGVDYVGLVFASRSPRRLSLVQAGALRDLIPDGIGVVALLMDNPADEVRAIIAAVEPDMLQFHGLEPDAFCAGFGLPHWKAIPMGGEPEAALADLSGHPSAAAWLFDGHGVGEQGGSGQRFDWTRLPAMLDRPFLLAGGLHAGNVGEAIRRAGPFAVDVSSGIEEQGSPGVKNPARMRAFVEAVRAADALPHDEST